MCLTPKLSKYVALQDASTLSPFTYKAVQGVSSDLYSSGFITYASSFILGKLFLEETPLNQMMRRRPFLITFSPALIVLSPALITFLPATYFLINLNLIYLKTCQ